MPEPRKIFISYRRADNPDFADRIRDWFIPRYGRDSVFMDFDSIPPGVKFADHIRSSMQQSDAVIVIIGPHWVELFQERAAKFEDDFVRIELGLALELGKPITPICINGAPVPARDKLPPELRSLLDYNITFLDRTNFYERIERIIAGVEAGLAAKEVVYTQASSTETQSGNYATSNSSAQNEDLVELLKKIAELNERIRANPQDAHAYWNRAANRSKLGDFSTAIADYNEAIRLETDVSWKVQLYYERALTHEANGDLKRAIDDFYSQADIISTYGTPGELENISKEIDALEAKLKAQRSK